MAVITKTLKASGGDYSSPSAWDAGEQTDLVAAGDSHVLECDAGSYADSYTLISGWVTGPNNNITIKAADGDEHGGVVGFGAVLNGQVYVYDNYVTIQDVEIYNSWSGGAALSPQSLGFVGDRLILRSEDQSSSLGNLYSSGFVSTAKDSCKIQNSLIIGGYIGVRVTRGFSIRNCTVINTQYRATTNGPEQLFENNVYIESVASDLSGYNSYGHSNLIFTSNANITGVADSLTGISEYDLFTDFDGGDYTLAAGSDAIGFGVDRSSYYSTDITNTTITDWSIGAFTFVSAATPTNIGPGIGTISASGLSPVLTAPADVSPGIGSTALSGRPVSVEAVSVVAPGIGTIAMSGLAPTVSAPADVSPGVGSVALTGSAVDVEDVTVVDPAVGDIAFTGSPVTVESPANIQPGQGSYAVTGIAVSLLTSVEIAPALGGTALTGFDLSVLADVDIAAGIGSLSLNGFSVSVDDEQTTSINPGAGSLALAGEIVGLSAVSDLTPGIGSVALSGESVSVESGFTLLPGVAAITCAGMAVTLDAITSGGLQHIGLPMLVMNKPTAVESLNYPVVQAVSFRTRLQIK